MGFGDTNFPSPKLAFSVPSSRTIQIGARKSCLSAEDFVYSRELRKKTGRTDRRKQGRTKGPKERKEKTKEPCMEKK